MFAPPVDKKLLKIHDKDILAMFYIFCEDNNVADHDDIQKSFVILLNYTGEDEFIEEFTLFESFAHSRILQSKTSSNYSNGFKFFSEYTKIE